MEVLYSFISDGLSDFFDVDTAHTALKVFFSMFAVTLLIAVLYYKVIDSAALNKKRHWGVAMAVAVVISGICGYLLISNGVSAYLEGNPANSIEVAEEDYYLTGVMNLIYSVGIFFGLSMLLQKFSHNCRVTPF